MAKATWVRLAGSSIIPPAQVTMPGGMMVMATAAKKHVTVFTRDRHAPGAGRDDIKAAFTRAAVNTRNIVDRSERNRRIRDAIRAANLATGYRTYRSRGKYELAGTVWRLPKGMSVTAAYRANLLQTVAGRGAAVGALPPAEQVGMLPT